MTPREREKHEVGSGELFRNSKETHQEQPRIVWLPPFQSTDLPAFAQRPPARRWCRWGSESRPQGGLWQARVTESCSQESHQEILHLAQAVALTQEPLLQDPHPGGPDPGLAHLHGTGMTCLVRS
mgnify:CR=1 FL=1